MGTPVYPPRRKLDPLHGTHDPVSGTPDRAPNSIRRTTTIDMVRPDGVRRDLKLIGRARDIRTNADGSLDVLDEAAIDAVVDYLDAVTITSIEASPWVDGLDKILGVSAATGFRAAVDGAIGELTVRGRPIYQLLDDVPVATLVSGYAVGFAGGHDNDGADDGRRMRQAEGMAALQVADLCAGFQAGGTIMKAREEGTRRNGGAVTGPVAPPLEHSDDPHAWHEHGAMTPDGMRRRRRIDLKRSATNPRHVEVDELFRDSHLGDDGYETIIHEYVVRAIVDTSTMTFVHAEALPQVLPWYECPQAAASAQRLNGRPLNMLRPAVRAEFLGPTTCTHLNDTLRALEDVAYLIRSLPE
ncbi:MAG: DUF2889 domain-containing protein [Acidimicrobiia bacterium]